MLESSPASDQAGGEQQRADARPEPEAPPDPRTLLARLGRSAEEIRTRTRSIHSSTLEASRHIREGNFESFAVEDIERLFHSYDGTFFGGLFGRLLARPEEGPLTFGISTRMTSAGGTTKQWRAPDGAGREDQAVTRYELSVSAPLLFQTFQEEEREVMVAGLPCADRLEALERVMEHEMLHLLELLSWRQSSCSRPRFQALALGIFGHTASEHSLVTQREIAHRELGIRVGDRVSFAFEGLRYTGRVNRITKRMTVLVDAPYGAAYSDGKRYRKFYVPLRSLIRA